MTENKPKRSGGGWTRPPGDGQLVSPRVNPLNSFLKERERMSLAEYERRKRLAEADRLFFDKLKENG